MEKEESFLNSESRTIFTIFTFNDNYELEATDGVGGLAELNTLLQIQRETAKHHVTTVNGDFLVATSLSTMTKGAHMVDLLNEMQVDFVVLGNHEFDFGPEEVCERIRESKFQWFGSNVFQRDQRLFPGCLNTLILEVERYKIGFFGICTWETRILSHPAETIFASPVETAQKCVSILKQQGADVIIAITHQSLEEDRMMAKQASGINLIVGGHDHLPLTEFEGETLIHKSGQNAHYLGRIDISLQRNRSDFKPISIQFSWRMMTNLGYKKDMRIMKKVSYYSGQLENLKSKPIARITSALDSKTYCVRCNECTMGNLVTDSVRELFRCDTVIIQGGCIRGDQSYHPGSVITYYDLNREFPFPNMIVMYRLKGCWLLQALEEGIRCLPSRSGCFPQISGLHILIDVKREIGKRIVDIRMHNDIPFDRENYYTVASTEFIRNGGDGYQSLTKGEALLHEANGMRLDSILADALLKKKEVIVAIDGRIRFVQ